MEKKVRKDKELTVGTALVCLFVGIAIFVPKIFQEETTRPPEDSTQQEETAAPTDAAQAHR